MKYPKEPAIINLLITGDETVQGQISKVFKKKKYNIFKTDNYNVALEIFKRERIEILFIDIELCGKKCLDILRMIKKNNLKCETVVIAGCNNRDIVIESLREGAIDYIEKPIAFDELMVVSGRATEKYSEKYLNLSTSILVSDDDMSVVTYLKLILEKDGFDVYTATSTNDALKIIENNKIDILILDVFLEDMNGIDVLKKAKCINTDLVGIMITGLKEEDVAIEALRAGAFDFINKPINKETVLLSIKKALERVNLLKSRSYRSRELKITSEIIIRVNEQLERNIEEKTSELDKTQTQLFQTSKLVTLGEMSAGLAHEMNQPLGGISLIIKSLQKQKEFGLLTDEELEKGFNDMTYCINRISKIIQHIRTFARQDTLKFINVSINDTIHNALSLLNEQLRLHEIEVVKDLEGDMPMITGEPYQLEQVWINLIINARDAVDEKKARLGDLDYNKKIIIKTSYNPKFQYVNVNIRDNGIGMNKETKDRAIEPFFTTKEVGTATGLGLSISYGIIESHKGKLKISGKEGVGTTVNVYLYFNRNNKTGNRA